MRDYTIDLYFSIRVALTTPDITLSAGDLPVLILNGSPLYICRVKLPNPRHIYVNLMWTVNIPLF